jgi:hypothetical protein
VSLPTLLRLGLVRGSRWRVLALFAGLALPPSILATLPLWTFLSIQLDRSVAADGLSDGLDVPLAQELVRVLFDERGGYMIALGLVAALLVALLVGPWSAGAALAEGRAHQAMRVRGLLAAAGDLYGRLLRMVLVAALPLGLAGVAAAGMFAAADEATLRALTEAAGRAPARWAALGAAVLFFLAHLTVDAGRAHLAAQPTRRSAFLAWVAGVWLVLRRPVRAVVIGIAGTTLGLGLAFALMALRGRLPGGPGATLAPAFVLATLATAAVAWGRSIRLVALSELVVVDAGERARKKAVLAARRAPRVSPTEPLLPAQPDPTGPAGGAARPLDVTAPMVAPPPPDDGPA